MALYHHITSIDATHLTATTTKGCALLGQPRCQPAMTFFRAQKPKSPKNVARKQQNSNMSFKIAPLRSWLCQERRRIATAEQTFVYIDEQHIINLKIRPFIRIQLNKRTLCWRLAGELNAPKVRQAVLHTSLLILITALVRHLLSP